MLRSDAPDATAPRPALAALAVAVLVAVVYVPACLENQFAVDDARFILENPNVVAPSGWRGWLALLVDPTTLDPVSVGGIFRPLRTLEFAVDHQLFELSAAGYHLHTLAWHVAAAVLAFHLLHRLVGSVVPAFLGAAFWALHPMSVEAVAWISGRGDVAMGACTFGALLLELGSDGRDRRRLAALLTGAVAMLYKETAVVLPALVFAVRLVQPRTGRPGAILPALRAAVPYAVLAGLFVVLRVAVEPAGLEHAHTFVLGGSTEGTLSTSFRSIGAYVVMALLPVRSDFDWYLNPSTDLLQIGAVTWLALLVTLVVVAVRVRASRPWVAAAITLFLFPLAPVANWPFQLGIPTTERFLYLSLLGPALLVAGVAARAPVRRPLALGVLAMGAIAFQRTGDWDDDATLLGSALRHGTSPRAPAWFAAKEREAGVALDLEAARTEDAAEKERLAAEARARFERALELAHESLRLWHRFEKVSHSVSGVVVNPHINAANSALFLGQFGEALWHSDRALGANDWLFPQPYYNRAMALVELGRHAEAVASLEKALELGAVADSSVRRRAIRCGEICTWAGAYDEAARAFRLVREAQPEVASRGLAAVDDAAAADRASPPDPVDLALRRAAVGAEVPAPLLDLVPPGPLRDFVAACQAERAGADGAALEMFERALAPATLPETAARRARLSVERIRAGCPAWTDQGVRRTNE